MLGPPYLSVADSLTNLGPKVWYLGCNQPERMSNSTRPNPEIERLKQWEEALDRMRLKNRRLARESESLITDFSSRGRRADPSIAGEEPNESTR